MTVYLSTDERQFIRDGVYVLSTTPRIMPLGPKIVLPDPVAAVLPKIDTAAVNGTFGGLDTTDMNIARELYKLLSPSEVTWARPAWASMLRQSGLTVPEDDEGFVYPVGFGGSPPPTIDQPAASTPASYHFDPDEIQKLGDFNYVARVELHHSGTLAARLYALAMALKDGSWPRFSVALDRSVLVSAMAATWMGSADENRPLLSRFAAAISASISPIDLSKFVEIAQPPDQQPAAEETASNSPPPPAPLPDPPAPPSFPDGQIGDVLALLASAGLYIDLETRCIGINGPPLRSRVTEGDKLPQIKLTLWGEGASAIAYVSNTSLTDPQRAGGALAKPDAAPQRYYVCIDSMGGDGGCRSGENAVYGPDGMYIPDGYRPVLNSGTDSRKHPSLDETRVTPNADGSGRPVADDVRGQNEIVYVHADFLPGNPFARCYGEPGQRLVFRWTRRGSSQSAFDDGVDLVTLRDEVRRLGGNV